MQQRRVMISGNARRPAHVSANMTAAPIAPRTAAAPLASLARPAASSLELA
jgi:hypothetical protein